MTILAFSPALSTETRPSVWTARVASTLGILFLAMDIALKVFELPPGVNGTTELGYAASTVLPIGLLELACFVLYLIPRTAPIGAVLFTGYLGGAIATHVHAQNPLFSHILFPIYVAVLLWLPLYLRDERVKRFVSR